MIAAKTHKVQGLESIIILIITDLLIKKFILQLMGYCRDARMVLISHLGIFTAKRVQLNGKALAFQASYASSILATRSKIKVFIEVNLPLAALVKKVELLA